MKNGKIYNVFIGDKFKLGQIKATSALSALQVLQSVNDREDVRLVKKGKDAVDFYFGSWICEIRKAPQILPESSDLRVKRINYCREYDEFVS